VLGALFGRSVSSSLAGLGELVAAGVLGVMGVWMIVQTRREGEIGGTALARVTTGRGVILLGASLSVDNLVVGFGMGVHGVHPLALAAAAGAAVLMLTILGLRLGGTVRGRWDAWARAAAGVLLLGVALGIGAGWF
jgi:manganese efflux pump family protein